jgi:release factor glutamine methyltransferase
MTYRESYAYGCEILEKAQIADARLDARLLLEYVCHTTQHDLILNGSRPLSEEQQTEYEAMIAKRSQRIPLQHITGEQEFMGFTFQVNEHVLIPRQDTEILVEEALNMLKPGRKVLDMCTGSGCILLSLLALAKDCQGIGADISTEALNVAQANLAGVSAQCDRALAARFMESDLFSQLGQEQFDVIVSNPPYIASAVIETLEPEVRLHEPISALDGTEDGLYFYRKIVTDSKPFLKKDGALLFEIGHDQGEAVAELMKAAGFTGVCVKKDYAGLDRVVYGFFEEEA